MARRLAGLVLLALLAACSPGEPPLREGPWRGEIEHYGRQLPFNFEVRRDGDGWAVSYLNGPERMPVERVTLEGDRLRLDFPSYSAELAARVRGASMSGEITLVRRDRTHHLQFRAEHGPTHRFFPQPAARFAEVGGRWAVRIEVPPPGEPLEGIGLFTQGGPYLWGTVQTQSGDQRYLAGEVRGNELYLSAFDGGGTQLWLGTLGGDGTLAGAFDSVSYGKSRWTARRDSTFDLADPGTLTYLRPGARLEFSFPDLDGNIVALADARFSGKVTLVILAGSWCPTCHDEARTMGPIYAEYASRGLELVYLMYEYSPDFATAEPQMRAYRERYGITHPMLFVGASARDTRAASLPMLNDIVAFPTTIFVDRAGRVRKIHTAFPGPATGQAHEDYKQEFRATVEALLAEA